MMNNTLASRQSPLHLPRSWPRLGRLPNRPVHFGRILYAAGQILSFPTSISGHLLQWSTMVKNLHFGTVFQWVRKVSKTVTYPQLPRASEARCPVI